MSNPSHSTAALTILLGVVYVSAEPAPQLLVERLDGPVTSREISAFKTAIRLTTPPIDASGNLLVYGAAGKAIEACGLMYEVTHDREILDRMIVFCDAALNARMDRLPAKQGGQRISWTGNIEPIWPSDRNANKPAGAAVEQGQVLSHVAYCIKSILNSPELEDQTIGDNDPSGFGTTYRQRAMTYLKQCDFVIDKWILPRFVDVGRGNRLYFPEGNNTYKPGQPAPWNQLFMLTNGLVRLAECHALLADDPKRVAMYDSIVKPNIAWFFANTRPQTSKVGTPCWIWAYSLARNEGVEDTNHASFDTEGLWIACNSGRFGISSADLAPLVNTYIDVVLATQKDGRFAGRVDGSTASGHAGGDNYVRDEYLYIADLRPEVYERLARIEIDSGKTRGSLPITARLLWLKDPATQSEFEMSVYPVRLTRVFRPA